MPLGQQWICCWKLCLAEISQMREIHEVVEELLPKAQAASEKAYSPYSKVRVGAVLATEDGRTFTGCNVENASYGITQCAERNALGAAVAAGALPGTFATLLIYSGGFETLSPCGACRQVMSELMGSDALVICCSDAGDVREWLVGDLIPDPFVLE